MSKKESPNKQLRVGAKSTSLRENAVNQPNAVNDPSSKKSKRESAREDFGKVVEKVPFIGPSLAIIIKRWGLIGFLLFLAGCLFSLSLVFLGALPEWMVASKYKQNQESEKSQLAGTKTTPTGPIEIKTVAPTDPRDWLLSFIRLMEDDAKGSLPSSLHIGSGAIEHIVQNPTDRSFEWSLEFNKSNYNIQNYKFQIARGFRETKDGLFQPLSSQMDNSSIRFTVPTCNKDDRIIALIIISWEPDMPLEDLSSILVSKAK